MRHLFASIPKHPVAKYLKKKCFITGLDLQKRWRNIRDAFVKAHKAKESKSGSAAKKKVPYVFYDNLLFIKDTVTVNRTDGNGTGNDDENTSIQTEINVPSMSSLPPKRRKKNNDDNEVGAQLVGVLSKNLERKNMDDDDDRLFFLSLVKEFKKIPEHRQMQTKLDILKVIKDAQQFFDYSNASWSFSRANNTYRGYQTAHYSRNNPHTELMQSLDVGRPPSQNFEVQSPLSTHSHQSQNSEHSSYIELFNSINDTEDDLNV
ncbi:uncharacterized protein LOC126779039 [Nymphalis io]|uniref:uncharacterized protein LOC126779039 n=1 Tax=Inachis io TaxID=171585 RepID=UPI0021679531|nr:uncharacterized protein LOC126779039 [Nymphalis io]